MMKYVGQGSFLPGVPARDLTAGEVKKFGEEELLASGLYEKVQKTSSKPKPSENKAESIPLAENKEK